MRPDARTLLRGFLKFLAVIVAGTAAGAAIGLGLSALSGNGGNEPKASVAATATPTPTTKPAGRTPAPTSTPKPAAPASGKTPEVQIQSAVLIPAKSASGKARRRARIVVRVLLKNRTGAPLTPDVPVLINGPGQLPVDPKARDAAGSLLGSVPAGANAVGELHFETAGDLTTRLTKQRRGRLRIAGTTVPLKIKG